MTRHGTVVRDGEEVDLPVAPIPQHNRPGGRWCRWSGCLTAHPDQLCPDRCQEGDEAAHGIHAAPQQAPGGLPAPAGGDRT